MVYLSERVFIVCLSLRAVCLSLGACVMCVLSLGGCVYCVFYRSERVFIVYLSLGACVYCVFYLSEAVFIVCLSLGGECLLCVLSLGACVNSVSVSQAHWWRFLLMGIALIMLMAGFH